MEYRRNQLATFIFIAGRVNFNLQNSTENWLQKRKISALVFSFKDRNKKSATILDSCALKNQFHH
jgi:hypothetical protein